MGSLESDAGRNIAYIRYDYNNNPTLIVFKDGHETEYVYSASGEKLRVIHNTAVYNVSKRTIGTEVKGKLDPNQTLYSDTTDYLLGGALTLRNGRIDKYQFEEGYCQAIGVFDSQPMQLVFTIEDIEVDPDEVPMPIADNFEFYYYDRDHLGNIRQVTKDTGWSKGDVVQTMDYYPFGAEFCDKNTVSYVQNHKYNGKEFDHMHGLNTYDYGARQYNPVTARWDRMDPHCEDYKDVSPYVYCHNNPVMMIDPDGKDDYYTSDGKFLGTNNEKTDYIYISDNYKQLKNGSYAIKSRVALPESDISAKALSKIFSHVVSRMKGVDLNEIEGGAFAVAKIAQGDGGGNDIKLLDSYGNINGDYAPFPETQNAITSKEGNNITVDFGLGNEYMFATRSNIQNMLGVHEYKCHFKNRWHHNYKNGSKNYSANVKIFDKIMNDTTWNTWNKTTEAYKQAIIREMNSYIPHK